MDRPGTASAAGPFVVRFDGTWFISSAEPSDGEPAEASLGEVLELLGPAAAGHTQGAPVPLPPLGALLIGRIAGNHLLVEGPDGLLRLGPEDLRAVDAVPTPRASGPATAPGSDRSSDLGPLHGDAADPDGGPVPVYAVWHPEVGPLLSLGMLTAAARHWNDGALRHRYEIRRPETPSSFLDDLADHQGPAVLLCSDYVWSLDLNLDLARTALAVNPDLVVIHGGPSSPKYEADAARFLHEHGPVAHVLTRGEGEVLLCELLDALEPGAPLDPDRLNGIAGITFRHPVTDEVVRTPDRERIADLDALPSPYLTGEFDHIEARAWVQGSANFETNRGCPYGCTFCDWGSLTTARIRKFDAGRVLAELAWVTRRDIPGAQLCDANFGILPRDVELAEQIAELRRSTQRPVAIAFTPPKNSARHITRIFDLLLDAGLMISCSISLQTTDEATLEAVQRSNISTDAYLELAAALRRRGQPLQGDVIVGLPGQTYESYQRDIQFFFDHEIMPRTWLLKILPNAPLNAPEYRAQHAIEADEQQVVRTTATMRLEDRERMLRLRDIEIIFERFGLLRHVLRYLQWDHGIDAATTMERLLEATTDRPADHPLLSWTVANFDLFPQVPVGPDAFYREVEDFVCTTFGLDRDDSGLATVLRLQKLLVPHPGRTFPATEELPHDYLAYYRSATSSLYDGGLRMPGDSRDPIIEGDFHLGQSSANELLSPLIRLLPLLGAPGVGVDGPRFAAEIVASLPRRPIEDAAQRVRLPIRITAS